MIKIKDVINRLQLYVDGNKTLSHKVANEAIQTIRELQNQIPKWHLCKDKLPQIDKEILFIDDFGEIFIGRFHVNDGSKKIWYANYLDDRVKEVIAWMELPKFEGVE